MNIGIIPCDNGLGHISRSIYLAKFLSKKFNIILYLPKKVNNIQLNKKIFVKKININFKILGKSKYNTSWYKKIDKNDLKKTNLLISDNLPEVVLLKKKTIIYANFFWNEILGNNAIFFNDLKKKILENNIRIKTNYIFSNIVNFKKNVDKIGFFGKYKKQDSLKKNGILISLGTSKIGYQKNFKIYPQKFKNNKLEKYMFYLDRNLIDKRKKYPKNIKVANFTEQMYKNIRIAIIKPGFGTIQDCLIRGIPIISYIQNSNKEFLKNAKILKKIKIGNYFFNFDKSLNNGINIFNDKEKLLDVQRICKKLKWKGEEEIKKSIFQNLNA